MYLLVSASPLNSDGLLQIGRRTHLNVSKLLKSLNAKIVSCYIRYTVVPLTTARIARTKDVHDDAGESVERCAT